MQVAPTLRGARPRGRYSVRAMAGPVVDVLLRSPLTTTEAAGLIASACADEDLTAEQHHPLGTDARTFVRGPDGDAVEIALEPLDADWTPAELDLVAQACGYRPAALLRTDGLTREPGAALLQARLLVALAERTGALIGLDDVLVGPDARGPGFPGAARLAAARELTSGRPGIVLEVADGAGGAFHVIDAVFLRRWMQDPDFHLPN